MDGIGRIIADRRDGKVQSAEDLRTIAIGAARGTIPDYQLSAWLMAAYLNPLSPGETVDLTKAMAHSGTIVDLGGLPKPWVDKHSSGGVGDKTTIVLLPLLACCGLTLVKMSGRGLGITGGTVDKLSSIPGFRLDLSPADLFSQAKAIGLAITGQTPDLAPADKVLYSLRDATSTVGSIPLIVSSILSKKFAGGAETVILDVKSGSGAFMKTEDQARQLAASLALVGNQCGLSLTVALTDMDQPLGSAVGNALEVLEAMRVVSGVPLIAEESRFRELCIQLAGLALSACGLATDRNDGERTATQALDSGRAKQKMQEWFLAQGAEVDMFDASNPLPVAPCTFQIVHSGIGGWVDRVDAGRVGQAVLELGGGREAKEDEINPVVGVQMLCHVGSRVVSGQVLGVVHSATEVDAFRAGDSISSGISVSMSDVAERPVILDVF